MNEEQLIQLQIEREELQHQLGLQKFKAQLEKKKLGMDYSNSTGGKLVQKTLMDQLTDAVKGMIQRAMEGAGINHGVNAEAYKAVFDLPVIDLDTCEVI